MAALDNIASELLKSANEADLIYKRTRDQAQRDKAVRLRRIVENLRNITLGASDLNGLSDVAISSPTNAQVLSYNSTTLKWQNTTISTATPTLAQVTTAGNTTTNSATLGGLTVNTTANAGGIALQQNGTLIAELRRVGNNNRSALYLWNNNILEIELQTGGFSYFRTNSLAIGTPIDAGYKLDVNGTGRFQGALTVYDNFYILRSTFLTDVFSLYSSTNSGITTPGRGQFIITHGGREVMRAYADRTTFVNGGVQIGTNTTPVAQLQVTGSITAASALARGVYFNNTLVAAANNDVLVGLDINPTFTNGAFTGVENVGLRITSATPIFRLDSSAIGSFHGIEFRNTGSIDAQIKQLPSSGEFRISNGRFAGWNGFITLYTDTVERMRIRSNGNVLIGTTTDAGYKLDVNGSTRIKGTGTTDSTIALLVQNNTGRLLLQSDDGGFTRIGGPTARLYVGVESGGAGARLVVNGEGLFSNNGIGNAGGFYIDQNGTSSASRTIWYDGSGTPKNLITGNGDNYITSGNFGLGTTTPTDKFHIVDNTNGNKFARISAGGTDASAAWVAQNDQVDNVVYRVFGSAVTGSQMGQALARSASLIANLGGTGKFLIGSFSGTDLIFGTSDQARMRLVDATGNFLIGTMTDTGNKLTVSGDIDAQGYKVNNVLGYTGILNIPTNPPGQQNIDIQGGIVINIF